MSKVSPGSLTVVIFALLAGLGGAFIIRQEMAKPQGLPPLPEAEPKAQMYYVPVAAFELDHGHTLSFGDIAIMKFTPEEMEKSVYSGKPYMADTEQLIGRTLQTPLEKGMAFTPDLLYPEGMGPGIAERLQPGYRAVTVPIHNVGAVHGFARPGAYVDVLFRALGEGDRPELTLTLLERIQILAINTTLLPNSKVDINKDGTVTLAVTPQQAKILKVVEGRGEMSLALRHPDDNLDYAPFDLGEVQRHLGDVSVDTPETPVRLASEEGGRSSDTVDDVVTLDGSQRVTLEDLLGIPRKLPTKQMEIFLGGQRQVVEFESNKEQGYQLLQRGGRIKTPIAHDVPKQGPPPMGTAQLERSRMRMRMDRP